MGSAGEDAVRDERAAKVRPAASHPDLLLPKLNLALTRLPEKGDARAPRRSYSQWERMRLQLNTAAALLEDEQTSLPEFGTGLRARLELVRPPATPEPSTVDLPPARRDVSPELMLVSPQTGDPSSILAELFAQRVRAARREPLGELLAEDGLLDEAEIELALSTARRSGKRLGEVLIEYGLVRPVDVVRIVAEQRGLPFLDVGSLLVDPAAARLLPADHARVFRTLPIGFVRGLPVVALADPSDEQAIDGARSVLRAAEFVASPEESILEQFARVYVPAPLHLA